MRARIGGRAPLRPAANRPRGPSLRLLRLAATAVLLAACTQGQPQPAAPDLAGTWEVTRTSEAHTIDFGTSGPMTVAFSDPDGGNTRFLGVDVASGMTVCRDFVATMHLSMALVIHDPADGEDGARWAFVLEESGPDTLTLANERETIVLTRVTGTAPVAECGAVEVAPLVEVNVDRPSWTSLSAVDDTLYFNTGGGNPIVGYSLATAVIASSRSFTSFSSSDRIVVAAESDSVFTGHCACGRSHGITRFDLDADAVLIQAHTGNDIGAQMIVRYGYATDGHIVIGGIEDGDLAGSSVNLLATLEPATLALVEQRTILDGVQLADVTLFREAVHAITFDWDVVEVGADGRAVATYTVPNLHPLLPRGIASVGDELIVLATDWAVDDRVTLVRLTLP